MYFIAKSAELKKFREAKNLTQYQIAELLNMEQTTYSKKERGKTPISYNTALAISAIIDKKIDEFLEGTSIINNITESTFTNSSVNGDVVNNNGVSFPEKLIKSLEELILLVKENYNKSE